MKTLEERLHKLEIETYANTQYQAINSHIFLSVLSSLIKDDIKMQRRISNEIDKVCFELIGNQKTDNHRDMIDSQRRFILSNLVNVDSYVQAGKCKN